MFQSDSAPWLEFFAWNTDGSAKTDLVFNTAGISIVVVRDNLANSAALTLSAASGPTDWAAGKFWPMGGNKYRVGIATALISSFTGQISVEGIYTGGVITGVTREVSAYDPTKNPLSPLVAGRQIAVSETTGKVTAEAVVLDSATVAKIDDILLDTGTTLPAAIAGISGGGGGGGDATQATLLEVKAKTDLIGTAAGATTLLAAAVLEPGTITSFPETLRIGDSYTDIIGRGIQMPIIDSDGTPLTAAGSNNLADATATFVIKRANDTESSRIITGSATFIDPPGTGTSEAPYALIEISSSETYKGLVKYRYTGLLTFTWPYVGTGTDAEVMTFETGTITFEA